MSAAATADMIWPSRDGSPVACVEKLKVLRENHAELAQVMRDAFEDAILMGVDETALRRLFREMVDDLQGPRVAASDHA